MEDLSDFLVGGVGQRVDGWVRKIEFKMIWLIFGQGQPLL